VSSSKRPSKGTNITDLEPADRANEKKQRELFWERQKKRGPYSKNMVYKLGKIGLADRTVSAESVRRSLDYLFSITNDEVFRAASLALDDYGLTEGGLQQRSLRLLRETGRDIISNAAKRMSEASYPEAERVASQFGVPGSNSSLDTVIKELVTARKELERKLCSGENQKPFPSGNTGRRLLVRFAMHVLDANGEQRNDLFGIIFDDDGFAIAPDTRDWRREISVGRIAFFGYLAPEDGHGAERREAWRRLNALSDRKN
jgi:hypothetical protein